MTMTTAKTILIAAAISTIVPLPATAAFVDHQAIRACFARAQFELTQNSGKTVIADQALVARKAHQGWTVKGDLYVSEATRNGLFRLNCSASDEGISIELTEIRGVERLDR